MSGHDLLDAIGAGFARLVELAPQFDEATIPVDHNDSGDWTLVGDDLRDAMSHEAELHPDASGIETQP
ncbi:MAG: hypothetical protein EXQ50_02795 [Acidobacteria bacterium]|nr:hypothetical protein [Acidobacteriota bacterium]